MTKAIGYTRVSTARQGESGLGLADQRQTIASAVQHRGWTMGETFVDVASGGSVEKRPQLGRALSLLDRGEADVIVVAKLDRLSRSLLDFAEIMARARRNGWAVVTLDMGIDTTTPNGELLANIIMAMAQWERRIISDRIRAALGVKKERGDALGRNRNVSEQTLGMIEQMRADGESYAVIAEALNGARVPTAQGGKRWHASTVRAISLQERPVTD